MQASRILSKAVERDVPGSISFDSSIKFIHIISGISGTPLYTQNTNFLFLCILSFRWLPRVDLNGFESFIVWVKFLFCVFQNLGPGITYSFIFFAQLPHNVCKINNRLVLVRLELQRNLTQIETFLEFI